MASASSTSTTRERAVSVRARATASASRTTVCAATSPGNRVRSSSTARLFPPPGGTTIQWRCLSRSLTAAHAISKTLPAREVRQGASSRSSGGNAGNWRNVAAGVRPGRPKISSGSSSTRSARSCRSVGRSRHQPVVSPLRCRRPILFSSAFVVVFSRSTSFRAFFLHSGNRRIAALAFEPTFSLSRACHVISRASPQRRSVSIDGSIAASMGASMDPTEDCWQLQGRPIPAEQGEHPCRTSPRRMTSAAM